MASRLPTLRYALSFSLFSLSSSARSFSSTSTSASKWLVRPPSPTAPRECPTPLILVRTPSLSKATEEKYTSWAGMFAEKGYTTVEADIDGPSMVAMVGSLNSQIRLLAIPFPPVLIASGPACLLTQAYISDHPASGLVLISPPGDEVKQVGGGIEVPKLTYEPTFPILLVGDDEGALKKTRLGSAASKGVGRGGKGVTIELMKDGERGEGTRINIERWLDRCGF